MSSTIYFVNCAFTNSLTQHLIESIDSTVRAGRHAKVFIEFSGFKDGKFNGKSLSDQLEDFSGMPSNLRFRFDNTDETGKTRVDGLVHDICQEEITKATFDFFNQIGIFQEEGKQVEIIFTAMTRPSRPFTLVIQSNLVPEVFIGGVKLGANNNIKQNLRKYDRRDLNKEPVYLTPDEEFTNVETYSDDMVTTFVNMLSKLCGSELNSNLGNLCSEKIESKIKNKQLTCPVLCPGWEGTNGVSPYENSKITYLADVFGMAASLLYLEEKDLYFDTSTFKSLIINAKNEKRGESPIRYTTFVPVEENINASLRNFESTQFTCSYLKENELSKPNRPILPLKLLSKVMETMYIATSARNLNTNIEVFCDDGVTDIDDYILRKIFDRLENIGIFHNPVNYYCNNSFTSKEILDVHGKEYIPLYLATDTPIGGGKKKKSSTGKKNKQSGGKKSTPKKIRKHQGIYQSGGKAGRLKPGYRYTGEKTSSGLKVIAKK